MSAFGGCQPANDQRENNLPDIERRRGTQPRLVKESTRLHAAGYDVPSVAWEVGDEIVENNLWAGRSL